MSSLISRLLDTLYPRTEARVLMVSLDAAGKTTILYQLKLGEVVTTMPTIGFNVETFQCAGMDLTVWDVGGCDKIRPLWRHYYKNTNGVVFVVDSNDHERISTTRDELHRLLDEPELQDAVVLVFANKQDLPNALNEEQVAEGLDLKSLQKKFQICVVPCSGTRGEGLDVGMEWMVERLRHRFSHPRPVPGSTDTDDNVKNAQEEKPSTFLDEEAQRQEALLIEWLEREDEPDDAFLQALDECTLDTWDHRTHLRIAWLFLTRFGRREGLEKIFASIKHFISNSPRTARPSSRGTTFHETMTYFWSHMVHYAIVATRNPGKDFRSFLLLNPQLVNGGLFLHYYSKKRMLLDAEARTAVLLPDLRPLPSVLSSTNPSSHVSGVPIELRDDIRAREPMSDEEFMTAFNEGSLTGWGHESKLRLIYVLLRSMGRRGKASDVLKTVSDFEGETSHETLNYFWLQMISFNMALLKKNMGISAVGAGGDASDFSYEMPFSEFMLQPRCQALRNELLYLKYYTKPCIDRSANEFVLPDIKQLPNVVS
eukprot:CAMPEP_0185018178 /NCGR_PEP_ID=MMETSP1103-20130426/987_1 /TAXON_ID=36769 /ORGANISM="Paraphysomonas bandaiensis, Strain Caron Lab Isolate" /LENGTH=539 /DNA_ID=CAMNT_0027547899 /DNA_START=74 /DNA_END=1693 /DNA_ORIENTATION=-